MRSRAPLSPMPGTPGHVVHRVADERQHVHHPLGRHAELLLHRLAVVERRPPSPRGPGSGPGRRRSRAAAGPCRPRPPPPCSPPPTAWRARVAITSSASKPGSVDDGQAEDLAHPAHVGELHREVVVHLAGGWPCTPCTPRGGRWAPGTSKRDADALRLLVLVELAQHGGEAVGRVRGQAAAGGQAADREVGAVELRAAVDEVDVRLAAGHRPAILSLRDRGRDRMPRPCWPASPRSCLLAAAGLRGCVAYEYEHEFWLRVDGSGSVYVTGRPELWAAFKGLGRRRGPEGTATREAARAALRALGAAGEPGHGHQRAAAGRTSSSPPTSRT